MPEFKPYFILFISVFLVLMLTLAGMVGYLLGKNNSNTINTANQANSQLNSQQPSIPSNSSGQPAPVPSGKCGDGVCGPVESQLGVCPKDCGTSASQTNGQPNNNTNGLPQKPNQFTPLFQQEQPN